MIRTPPGGSASVAGFGLGLAGMAGDAETLAVPYVIPTLSTFAVVGSDDDRRDMVGVSLARAAAYAAAGTALPVVTPQDGRTPSTVAAIAVAASGGVRPVLDPLGSWLRRHAEHRHLLGHQFWLGVSRVCR